jgi:hypothetical protein
MSQLVLFIKYYLVDKMKEDEMGWECDTRGKDKKLIQNFV